MNLVLEALQSGFMQQALVAVLLASLVSGVLGSLILINRLVFLAGGIAHASYGGIGLAFFLGLPVLPVAGAFALGCSGIAAVLLQRNVARLDAIVGALWAGGMAFGILLLDMTPGYNVDLMSYLFGSILTISSTDIYALAVLCAVLLVLVARFYHPLVLSSWEPEYARTRAVPVAWIRAALLAMTALSVVLLIRMVGLILVIALLSIPPAFAEAHSRNLKGMMLRATLVSAICGVCGLLLAWVADLTAGACIIALAAGAYLLQQMLLRRRR